MIERIDLTLLMAWLALLAGGLVLVASAAAAQDGGAGVYLGRQALFAAASLAVVAIVAAVPLRALEAAHRPCMLLALGLCLLVLAPFLSLEVNGARRWIDLGVFRFQPAEAAKLLVAVYLAGYVAHAQGALASRAAALVRPLAWVGALLLLLLLQPDFGSVVIVALLAAGMLFLGGARLRYFAAAAAALGLALGATALLDAYRVKRLTTFLDPWASQFDGGYQLTQALIGFGRGEIFGRGLGDGVQKLHYLPEAHNDFIFAVIAEELGLLGAAGLVALLGFVTWRMLGIARRAIAEGRMFAGFVAYGAALLIGVQTVINVGVNTGVLPTKGLTLPFISFGGNSLLVCSALLALALRVHYEQAPAAASRAAAKAA